MGDTSIFTIYLLPSVFIIGIRIERTEPKVWNLCLGVGLIGFSLELKKKQKHTPLLEIYFRDNLI